ncbi:MAG TPA: GTP 3',8-cyclase MoaA [Armatimonadetes bacterium]|nr:GTP 3',8-cyclase MoaA [Armatimonadota bacterium]
MQIEVRLFASLRKYLPEDSDGRSLRLTLPEGATVADALEHLGISPQVASARLINGRPAALEVVLHEGDVLSLIPPLAGGAATEGLIDRFGRSLSSLRLSVTDRCNFRCLYCMPEEGVKWLPRTEILTFEELARIARIFVRLGVTKIRLTGGEPLVRKDLPVLVRMLSGIEGLQDLALTTNGFLLRKHARSLKEAGLRRLNVSLDTLDPEKFARLTRRRGLEEVLAGLEEAERVGFWPLKINTVALRGVTDGEILAFAELARRKPYQVRFIEYMPLDAGNFWEWNKVLTGQEILAIIKAVYPLEPVSEEGAMTPARRYRFVDGRGEIGIIASVTQPFCDHCDRLRVTADGKLRTCLFAVAETDLRTPLRGGATDEEIANLIREAVWHKEAGHKIKCTNFTPPLRCMSQIGG